MTRTTLHSLGAMVRTKRGDDKLRATAKQIGISAPTLLRVEAGHVPDVDTFGKICQWLEVDPKKLLGIQDSGTADSSEHHLVIKVSAHFKADRTAKRETIQALATMLLLASNELAPTRIPRR